MNKVPMRTMDLDCLARAIKRGQMTENSLKGSGWKTYIEPGTDRSLYRFTPSLDQGLYLAVRQLPRNDVLILEGDRTRGNHIVWPAMTLFKTQGRD